ncbi:hypothetical protein SLS53_008308 [Cytospora paraplurivora]|uniref:Uncharacterized protein n=1 Tax=Cytospora paraplurivora TaxID=2898453 RepID=A0AAN9U0R5_9PEZI
MKAIQVSRATHPQRTASYDNQQLKKLDAKRTLDNRSPPRGSALSASMRSLQDAPAGWANGDRPHIQLPQLSLPTRTKPGPILESPRYADTPLNSAVSPRSTPFAQVSRSQEYRSSPIEPNSAIDFNKSPYARTRRHNSSVFADDLTPADSYDQEVEFPLEETSRLRQFHIDEGQHSRMNSFDNQSVEVAYWTITNRNGDLTICGTEIPEPESKVYNHPAD